MLASPLSSSPPSHLEAPFPWTTILLSSPWVCSLSVPLLCPQSPAFSPNSASRLFQPRHFRSLQRCCIPEGKVVSIPMTHRLRSSPTHLEIPQPRPMSFVLFFHLISPRTALQLHDVRATIYPPSTRVLHRRFREIFLRTYPTRRLPNRKSFLTCFYMQR